MFSFSPEIHPDIFSALFHILAGKVFGNNSVSYNYPSFFSALGSPSSEILLDGHWINYASLVKSVAREPRE